MIAMNELEIKRILGTKIKSFRKSKGYSQDEFGSIIGLEQKNLSRIENGKAFPDIKTLCMIICKAKAEPNFILGFLNHNKKSYSSLDFELLNLIIETPDQTKEAIKNLLISLK